ncbi:hypothetical protein MNBD_DELTA01-1605 [hydrothermal vent metagenome]|uniref:HTH marR-type domain-containing protein n=1 Tax=hydrothermal vent metagenome TaxID=652676 RepID=A0A3B0QQW7_9ZZZZ
MGTHYKGSRKEKQALNAYVALMRAAESVTSRTTGSMTEAGLTLSQFGVLEAIYHLGPLCQRALAEKILKSTGNIVVVVDNLERQSLVVRRRDKKDRRYVTVHLTDKGRWLVGEVFPKVLKSIVREMEAIEGAEQVALYKLCRKLGKKKDISGKKGSSKPVNEMRRAQ